MMKRKYAHYLLFLILGLSLFGCTKIEGKEGFQGKKVMLSSYANDIGFSLTEPTKSSFDVETSFQISGEIKEDLNIDFPHLWLVAEHEDKVNEPFNYYVAIIDGQFAETITLPFGAGDYHISIRVPYDEQNYYDVATFSVNNIDEHQEQIPEYTRFGLENELQINNFAISDGVVSLTGAVAKTYTHDKVLIEVRKDEAI